MKKIIFYFCLLSLFLCKKTRKKKVKKKSKNEIYKFYNATVYPNSVVIFEYNNYHYECLPGYSKYFTDLGFNVDVIIQKNGVNSLAEFEPKNKIRIFTYKSALQIRRKDIFRNKLKMYNYSLLHSTDKQIRRRRLFRKLGFYANPNSLFIVHATDYLYKLHLKRFIRINHVFGLADYGRLTYVNPNYFGKMNLTHTKNKKITFYLPSSKKKYYSYLILGARNLKNKLIDFEINITGGNKAIYKDIIPKHLRNNFIFHRLVSYTKLYSIIKNSDFIILNLFPHSRVDRKFRTIATGSAQQAYCFNKPVIVEESFAKVYKFTNKTAIIFKNHDLCNAMEKASNISEEKYENMTYNMKLLKKSIYNISLNNLKKALNM